MRIVFLDVDGVLNCITTRERYKGFIGVDSAHVEILSKIIEISNREEKTEIVLSSSWRIGQDRDGTDIPDGYMYLMEKLSEYDLNIFDDTPRLKWGNRGRDRRGREIAGWLYLNREKNVTGYVVLDDEPFEDFRKYRILPHLVLTSFASNGGLREEHIKPTLTALRLVSPCK